MNLARLRLCWPGGTLRLFLVCIIRESGPEGIKVQRCHSRIILNPIIEGITICLLVVQCYAPLGSGLLSSSREICFV